MTISKEQLGDYNNTMERLRELPLMGRSSFQAMTHDEDGKSKQTSTSIFRVPGGWFMKIENEFRFVPDPDPLWCPTQFNVRKLADEMP